MSESREEFGKVPKNHKRHETGGGLQSQVEEPTDGALSSPQMTSPYVKPLHLTADTEISTESLEEGFEYHEHADEDVT